jgi:hypothetical protein
MNFSKAIPYFIFLTLAGNLFSQDQGYYLLPHTPEIPVGEYVPLPADQYVHSNTVTRIVQGAFETFVIPPNLRIYPSTRRQTETAIVRHPMNHSIMFASANVQSPGISEGAYVTTNSGLNWCGRDTVMGLP